MYSINNKINATIESFITMLIFMKHFHICSESKANHNNVSLCVSIVAKVFSAIVHDVYLHVRDYRKDNHNNPSVKQLDHATSYICNWFAQETRIRTHGTGDRQLTLGYNRGKILHRSLGMILLSHVFGCDFEFWNMLFRVTDIKPIKKNKK